MSNIPTPIPQFLDLDGSPLEDGYIYLGEEGQDAVANPIQAYWDEDLSVTAQQPIRTIGGYPAYQGAVKRIYLAEDTYSVTTRNKNGVPVLTNERGDKTISAADLASNSTTRGEALIPLLDTASASLIARPTATAAALVSLSENYPRLTGKAGQTHIVEQAPYPTRDNLYLDLNGATLRNTNTTPIASNDRIGTPLMIGVSIIGDTNDLTFYTVSAVNGLVLTVGAGEGSNFTVGEKALVRGAIFYTSAAGDVYRNVTPAMVVAQTTDTITLDRGLPPELAAEATIKIANLDEGIPSSVPGPPYYYWLFNPHLMNGTLQSDLGYGWAYGGVIDGTFRDLTIIGRNGIALNAMCYCLFENIKFRSWRKICELAENSYSTTVRTMRGTLGDASTKNGGADDTGPFFVAFGENSAHCTYEDFDVSSGPNDAGAGASAVLFGSGHDNVLRNSRLNFPAHTGYGIGIISNATVGNPVTDCGVIDTSVWLPVCDRFFHIADAGGGMVRPYLRNVKFYGAPVSYAGRIYGTDGVLDRVWCEAGALAQNNAAMTGWSITNCTFPGGFAISASTFTGNTVVGNELGSGGFTGLTNALLKTNDIRGNDSTANRALRAAALTSAAIANVTTTTPNTVYSAPATFTAGNLAVGDKIFFNTLAATGAAGVTNRDARVSVTSNGVTTGIGAATVATAATDMSVSGEIEVMTDTVIAYKLAIGGTVLPSGQLTVSSIAANGLTVNLEYWVAAAGEPITVRGARIIPVKPGMTHLPIE